MQIGNIAWNVQCENTRSADNYLLAKDIPAYDGAAVSSRISLAKYVIAVSELLQLHGQSQQLRAPLGTSH